MLQSGGTYGGKISGTGSVIVPVNSNLTLTGTNSYSGGATVSVGATMLSAYRIM